MKSVLPKDFLVCLIITIALLSVKGCDAVGSRLTAGSTNVVLIIIDTLRADHLGCYGYNKNTTPRIDRLAGSGIVLTNAISQSPWTRPSVASIVTSTYPLTHGIVKEKFDGLVDEFMTMAELLNANNYNTLGFTSNPNLNDVFGFDQGFDTYMNSNAVFDWMLELDDLPRNSPTGIEKFLSAKALTDRVLDNIPQISQPFFLQVFYMDPHYPYTPPPPYDTLFGGKTEKSRYDGEIAYTDDQVGRLTDSIMDRFPNTLIIITSDHGEGFFENNNSILDKRHGNFLYDTIVHVPLIIHHPSLKQNTLSFTCELIDLFPTVLELLGLKPPAGTEGTSFAGAIRGGGSTGKQFAYMETGWRQMKKAGLRGNRWKYIMNMDHEFMNDLNGRMGKEQYFVPDELYDLSSGEPERTRKNLSEKYPDVVDSLKTRLLRLMHDHSGTRRVPTTTQLDEYTEEQLKALGYLGGTDEH